MIRIYTPGGIAGAVIGSYLGHFIDIFMCFGVVFLISKITYKIFNKVILPNTKFLLFSILYLCIESCLFIFNYKVSEESDISLMFKLSVIIGAYFGAGVLHLLKNRNTNSHFSDDVNKSNHQLDSKINAEQSEYLKMKCKKLVNKAVAFCINNWFKIILIVLLIYFGSQIIQNISGLNINCQYNSGYNNTKRIFTKDELDMIDNPAKYVNEQHPHTSPRTNLKDEEVNSAADDILKNMGIRTN